MQIQITVWCSENGQENHETITITEEDICQLAEQKVRKDRGIYPKIVASQNSMAIIDL